MQDLAHVKVNGETILVLRRQRKYGVSLKIRKSGVLGRECTDEGLFLESSPQHLAELKSGKVIGL